MMTLDRTDKKILNALQANGRMANAELAKKIGMSKTACWNRTQRLIEEGYIKEVKAILHPEKLGLPVLVCVGITLDKSTPDSFAAFERAVKKIPAILECILLAGEFDYWLKIRVKDIDAFNRLYAKTLLHLPWIQQVRTFFALQEIKNNQGLQIE